MYHLYGGCEAGDGLQHAHRVTVVEGLTGSLQGVHVLQVTLCLIESICDVSIKLTPDLSGG